jgi:hypothetical protein
VSLFYAYRILQRIIGNQSWFTMLGHGTRFPRWLAEGLNMASFHWLQVAYICWKSVSRRWKRVYKDTEIYSKRFNGPI